MRVALIHYWLVTWRGGEHVLKAIADLFPAADLYCHVMDPDLVARELPGRNVRTTFISRLPLAKRLYQKYLPLMPLALEQLDLQSYDLVIMSDAGPAKGIIPAPDALTVCYCHSPMRYAWDRYHDYVSGTGILARCLAAPLMHYVRLWDQLSAQRVDHYVANSQFVSQRIRKYYGRSAEIIHPPVRTEQFDPSRDDEDFYLWVGQLVPYKRPDLLVNAFNSLGRPLVVIGEGPELPALRRIAKPNIRFMGRQPFAVVRDHYARCRALVFPGVEDFGIVPVEAMASGKPVIAYNYGGARETVIHGSTGILYDEATAPALQEAVLEFERQPAFDREAIRTHAERFSESAFKSSFKAYIDRVVQEHQSGETTWPSTLGSRSVTARNAAAHHEPPSRSGPTGNARTTPFRGS